MRWPRSSAPMTTMMPADPSTYCPVCGLAWQVRGCTPGKCNTSFDAHLAKLVDNFLEMNPSATVKRADLLAFAERVAKDAVEEERDARDPYDPSD